MITLPWGLACVATAVMRAGHEVCLLDLLTEPNAGEAVANAISKFTPEVIGVSVRNIDDQNMQSPTFLLEKVRETVAQCRELSSAPVVLGGAGYSIFPETALEFLGADMGIQGEGEMVLPALLERLERGTSLAGLPGLYLRDGGLQGTRHFPASLDDLPLPEEIIVSSWRRDNDLWLPLQARRGCSMDCSYCSTAIIEGRRVRQRSPQLVVEYVSRLAGMGFSRIFFTDNNFNIPRAYAEEICQRMCHAGLDILWRCILNPLDVDEALARAMFDSGCREVSLGFESGSEQILRRMNKRFTIDDVVRAASLLGKHGIKRMGFLLLGGPGETRESVEQSLAFVDSLGLESIRVTVGIRIYPNTPLAEIAIEEGRITPEDDLLFPQFYLARGLEGWLARTIEKWKTTRPHWIF